MNRVASSLLLLFSISVGSCTSVSITKRSAGDITDGLVFNRPDPYLLVTHTADGKSISSVVYLPNPDEEYVITPKMGIGTLDLKATLSDGWNLTSYGQVIDPQVDETITAIGGLASNLGAGPPGVATAKTVEPGLYKIVIEKGKSPLLRGPLPIQQ